MSDHDDFDRFVRRTMPSMLAFATWYCRDRQDACDAVQYAYVEAFQRWSTLEFPEAWMRATVRRRLIRQATTWWRRWRRGLPELEVTAPAASGTAEEAEALQVIRSVRLLPPRQRQIVVMRCFEGLPYEEIAAELGVSIGTVGAHLAKARERLTVLLGLGEARPVSGDPFITAARLTGVRSAGASGDPLVLALRAANAWLTRGFEEDSGTRERLRAAVHEAVRRTGDGQDPR